MKRPDVEYFAEDPKLDYNDEREVRQLAQYTLALEKRMRKLDQLRNAVLGYDPFEVLEDLATNCGDPL